MKRFPLILSFIFVLFSGCGEPQPDSPKPLKPLTDKIINGDFEEGSGAVGRSAVSGWVLSATGGTVNCNYSQEAHSGKQSLQIALLSANSYGVVSQEKFFSLKPSKNYRLSYWGKAQFTAEAPANDQGYCVNIVGQNAKGEFVQDYFVNQVGTNEGWTSHTCTFTTSPKVAQGILQLRLFGHIGNKNLIGTAWFDDVRLEEVTAQ